MMNCCRPLTLTIALALAAIVAGCGRGTSSKEGPASRPAAPPSTAAATSEPATSVLTISNRPYQFRGAHLIAETQDAGEPGVRVQVFSDGASPDGTQDGFYLEMTVDAADAAQLDGAEWQYQSTSNERAEDMLSAITVNGGANQLQPKDVTVTFRDAGADVVEVRLNGFFNVFNGRDTTAAGVVPVEATLLATRRASR